jgi:Kef-type K+ transport system membrane component KefB
MVFSRLHQPAVIGEVIGGILLGPSLLGRVAPSLANALLPASVAPFLNVIAQLGIILYMFLVGLELDLPAISRSGHVTVAISHASILAPFLLGAGLSLYLYPLLSAPGVPFTVFSLFLGVSLSVTAFPVLARILTDRGMERTPLGVLALTCAAVDDATAWCLLALVVSIAQAELGIAVRTFALTIAFVFLVLFGVRPLAKRFAASLDAAPRLTTGALALAFVAMLSAAVATEFIGVHAIFGAFLLGAVVPSSSRLAEELIHRLRDVISVLFLPAFFAFSGMRTQIGLLSGAGNWLLCGLIILVACLGKFGGTVIAARFARLPSRTAAALGILLNARGLVELIVLNIGLDLHLITPTLFTMLVLMALTTTFMATPILHVVLRRGVAGGGEALADGT